MKNLLKIAQLMVLVGIVTLWGCSSESGTATTSLAGISVISLQTDKISIQTDNIDTATIIVTVLDSGNARVPDFLVNFSSTGGELSKSSGTSDANGQVTLEVTSGTSDPTNQTIAITATYGTITETIPIIVYGSTVTLSSSQASLIVGGTAILTADVKNAASLGLTNIPTTLTITSGNATFPGATTTYTANTVAGQITRDITATAAGTISVTATALGATYTLQITSTIPASALAITTPATDPASQTAGTDQTVTASAPAASTYRFSTSIGTWVSSGTNTTTQVAGAAGPISETLQNLTGGTTTVVVSDENDVTKIDTTIIVFTSGGVPDSVIIQADKTVLAKSSATVQDSSTMTAYVTSSGLPVANTGVVFSFVDSTGTGAFLNTSYVLTDSTGRAEVLFTSGTQSTDSNGIDVTTTTVQGGATDSVNVVVGGTAGSVAIGIGSAIYENAEKTHYQLPIGILVADTNNNPAANATVMLSNWPLYAHPGYRYEDAGDCITVRTFSIANEDVNKNNNLDAGEDLAYAEGAGLDFDNDDPADPGFETETISADGAITPVNTLAGTLPATVTTDAFGRASFELSYLKTDSGFITTEITASTLALGTETVGKHSFVLYVIDDATEQCNLGPSRFNP